MMRFVVGAFAVLVGVVLVVVLVGWSLPVSHRVSRQATAQASPESVFALVANVGEYPRWREGSKRVEVLVTDAGGHPVRFREHGSDGAILYEVTERVPNQRLVTRIADPTLPFGGRWIYEITPASSGATLRITEEGEVYNPFFRFVSRFVMGHTRTIDQYLRDVTARLGGSGAIADG